MTQPITSDHSELLLKNLTLLSILNDKEKLRLENSDNLPILQRENRSVQFLMRWWSKDSSATTLEALKKIFKYAIKMRSQTERKNKTAVSLIKQHKKMDALFFLAIKGVKKLGETYMFDKDAAASQAFAESALQWEREYQTKSAPLGKVDLTNLRAHISSNFQKFLFKGPKLIKPVKGKKLTKKPAADPKKEEARNKIPPLAITAADLTQSLKILKKANPNPKIEPPKTELEMVLAKRRKQIKVPDMDESSTEG